jgi:hypothetical protein
MLISSRTKIGACELDQVLQVRAHKRDDKTRQNNSVYNSVSCNGRTIKTPLKMGVNNESGHRCVNEAQIDTGV